MLLQQKTSKLSARKTIAEVGDDFDATMPASSGGGDIEGKDLDPDALAFIKAKRAVDDLQRAKKYEKKIGAH